MSAPYEQPPPPGASRFRRWLSRAGGSHPDQPERELREEPAGRRLLDRRRRSAVALETLTDQSFALAMAAVAPFSTAVPRIGRGIRAAKDGAPRPSERLVDEGPANDVAPAAPRPPTPPAG